MSKITCYNIFQCWDGLASVRQGTRSIFALGPTRRTSKTAGLRGATSGGVMYVCRNSCIRRGYSRSADPQQAARELFESIYHPQASLGVFFCSTEYNLHALERELSRGFGDIPLIGCTSAGEMTPAGYLERRHHRLHPGQARLRHRLGADHRTCASSRSLRATRSSAACVDELEQVVGRPSARQHLRASC